MFEYGSICFTPNEKFININTVNLHFLKFCTIFHCRTPTPGQSTPHFSSRSPRNAKSNFIRLKKLLSLEENKKNDKRDLKNFLSSL